MKKNLIGVRPAWVRRAGTIKAMLIMKLTLLLLTIFVFNGFAEGVAQQVSFSGKNVQLKSVFQSIEKQTGYLFLYPKTVNRFARPVTINANGLPLEKFLEKLFSAQPLEYTVKGKSIFVSVRPEKLDAPGKPDAARTLQDTARTVTGLVTDEQGFGLSGVTATVKGTTLVTSTNDDGRFSLSVPSENNVLVFTYVGFDPMEVRIGAQLELTVRLIKTDTSMAQVVVVGYGTQRKVNLTGSVSTVDMKRQAGAPLTNASQLLQGVEGVYLNQPGGQPGRDVATIRIRGVGTLNNNNPLVLVNGIEFPLDNVNPADIESVSVLKDAASAAIYGSRAANGVVLITTKSGKKDRFTVDYNYYIGNQYVNYLPDFVTDPIEFMELRNQAQRNEGRTTVDYSDALIEEYREGMETDPNIYPNNRWMDIMFNPGRMFSHDLRFSGGSDKITHSLSLNYIGQEGVLRGTSSKRYALTYNTVAQMSKFLRIGAFLNASYKDIDEPVAGVANLMEMTFKAQAFHPLFSPDGTYANTFIRTPGHNVYRHPIALADEGKNNTRQQQILVNVFAEFKLPFNITYKINGAINKGDQFIAQFVPQVFTHQVKTGETQLIPFDGQGNAGARQTNPSNLNTTLFNTLNWDGKIGERHELKALLGFSRETFSDRSFFARNEGFLGNTLTELNAGSSNPQVGGTSSESRLNSFFGRLNYTLDEKYLFEANFRYDGSSRFAQGNQWGFFPSVSAGWRVSQEKFMRNVEWINEFKIRASIGQLGNQNIELFRYVNLVTLGLDYPFGTNISSGAAVVAYNDPSITWETTTISNIGIDMSLFNNKVDLTADVFRKNTTDILSAVAIPDQVGGLAGPIQNIGSVLNTGVEVNAGYSNNFGDFRFRLGGGFTYVKNEVTDLKGGVIYTGRRIIQEGYPIDSYYLINSVGIFQSEEEIENSPFQNTNTKPGYLKYEDVNKDNIISEADRVVQRTNIPRLTYQFTINLNYKRFSLNTFFQGVGEVYTYTENIGAMPFWFGTSVRKEWVTDAWTPTNTNARLPIVTTFEGSQNENFRSSNFWLKNASYLRMKNIQLTYAIPEHWTSKIGISNARVYVNGQNLLTFTPLEGFDPEKNLGGSTFYEFPTVKTVTAGINVTF